MILSRRGCFWQTFTLVLARLSSHETFVTLPWPTTPPQVVLSPSEAHVQKPLVTSRCFFSHSSLLIACYLCCQNCSGVQRLLSLWGSW